MKPVPPLLLLAEGRRTRPRREPSYRPREITLHVDVADVLRKLCLPTWRWSHFPSGEARDVRTGAKLKRMGLQKGWPDFLLIRPARNAARGQLFCLELKRLGEDLTPEQEAFAAWCDANAVAFQVARSLDEALTILAEWRCISKIGGVG